MVYLHQEAMGGFDASTTNSNRNQEYHTWVMHMNCRKGASTNIKMNNTNMWGELNNNNNANVISN